jgi:hypothetical protein
MMSLVFFISYKLSFFDWSKEKSIQIFFYAELPNFRLFVLLFLLLLLLSTPFFVLFLLLLCRYDVITASMVWKLFSISKNSIEAAVCTTGADEFLGKPFNVQAFKKILHERRRKEHWKADDTD